MPISMLVFMRDLFIDRIPKKRPVFTETLSLALIVLSTEQVTHPKYFFYVL